MAQNLQTIDTGKFRKGMLDSAPKFEAMLKGSGIPIEKFNQIAITAVLGDPKIMQCNMNTIMLAIMDAAQDGLAPDRKEGAIVPYRDKELGWRAVWIPMIEGLRKKIVQSGEVIGFICEVVHEGDDFYYELGDSPTIRHVRRTDGGRLNNKITHAYSVADFRDGYKSRHVMTIAEIEQIRDKYSKAQYGPWSDPMAFPEMCKKTVARGHSKTLPMSADAYRVFRRLDAIQGIDQEGASQQDDPRKLMEASSLMLDHFAGGRTDAIEDNREPAPERKAPRKGETKSIGEMADEYTRQALAFVAKVEDGESLNEWAGEQKGAFANLSQDQKDTINKAIGNKLAELQNAGSQAN